MQYSDKVIEHFSNPHNVGEIENASGVGTVGNAKCGDIMRIYLDIDEDTKIIKIASSRHLAVVQLLQQAVWLQIWLLARQYTKLWK